MEQEATEKLECVRHSAAHVMAAAVSSLFEQVRLDIGPSTAEGFYYDFDLPHRLTPEDFPRIEEEMQRIIAADLPFERLTMPRDEAERLLREKDQPFKLERLADIPPGEEITFYRCGDFMDLCRGPHVESTGGIPAFKLLSVAGSYYRGRETNPMLQRLYGTAFPSSKALRAFLRQLEEAGRRDHRRLGKELDFFSISEEVGPGLVLWHPRAARVRTLIEDYWKCEHFRRGYELLYTPHIGRAQLWETSGHLGFYSASMYAPMDIDGKAYYLKPMNCPFHIEVYRTRKRSYRDLPLRWAELGTVYRYEKAGVLHGLPRVRGFTQDDAHIICTPDQVEQEITAAVRFATDMWRSFGFKDISAYIATRPEDAVGAPERWEQATTALHTALRSENLPFETDPGGGAFYGPKIDLKVKDAIGREWQMSTIQFDFNLPERFAMEYTGEDGHAHRPYMVHRALLGSIERFFGILVEHYAGAFPLWLAPEQIRILPLTEHQAAAAGTARAALEAKDFRVTVDSRSEKIGARIRQAQLAKIPYMAIIGSREAEQGSLALRCRVRGDLGAMSLEACSAGLAGEIAARATEPAAFSHPGHGTDRQQS